MCFVKIHQAIYKQFGSGAMHSPYAIFQKYTKQHNDQKKIRLIQASDTRMGGHVIALQCLLRIKPALQNMVASCKYIMLKVSLSVCFVLVLK